jgi:hypothetical protein
VRASVIGKNSGEGGLDEGVLRRTYIACGHQHFERLRDALQNEICNKHLMDALIVECRRKRKCRKESRSPGIKKALTVEKYDYGDRYSAN